MDEKKITAFLAVANTGSFSKAAVEMNYTQSGVTQMMNRLEEEMGCKLLKRSFDGCGLTEAGERLLPYFENADRALRQLYNQSKQIKNNQLRVVRVGTFASISNKWLPRIIKAFQNQYPDTLIDIKVECRAAIFKWLLKGSIDLALLDKITADELEWIPLYEDPFFVIAPKSYHLNSNEPISMEALIQYPFIMPDNHDMRAHIKPWLENEPLKTVYIDSADDSTLLSLVEQGIGMTILPELSLGSVDSFDVLKLTPPLSRTLGIALPRSASGLPRKFTEFLKADQHIGRKPESKF